METSLPGFIEDNYFNIYINGILPPNLLEIEGRKECLNQYEKSRIEQWCKKLNQLSNTTEAKENRNFHAVLLLDQVLNGKLDEPFNIPGSELNMAKLTLEDVVDSLLFVQ